MAKLNLAERPLGIASELRIPPQDLEAEQSVLGAMILSQVAIITVQQILKEEDFYRERHRKIYRAIVNLNSKNEPVDIVTLTREIKTGGESEFEASALTDLLDQVPTAANAEYYANIVKECAKKRWIIQKCTQAVGDGYSDQDKAEEIVERLVNEIINSENISQTIEPMDLGHRTFDLITDAKKSLYIPTGFKDMDSKINGIRRGVFGTVTGESETGKSTFCQNMALHMAKLSKTVNNKKINEFNIAYIILEDSPERFVQRQICMMNNWNIESVESNDPRVLGFTEKARATDDWIKLGIRVCGRKQVGSQWKTLKLWILREWKKNSIDMFFIDGGERLYNSPTYGENRWDAQERMVAEIEDLAQSMNVGFLVIIGQSKTKKDKFHHVDEDEGGSNAWRKLARQRFFVSRHPDAEKDTSRENISLVKITKNSDGPKGTFWFEGTRKTYRWKEME